MSRGASRTKAIGIISGKGGSGKTAVSLAIGYMLADLGFRAILVDTDLATHGMTYFFTDRLRSTSAGLIDMPRSGDASLLHLLELSENGNLRFVPSVGDLANQPNPSVGAHELGNAVSLVMGKAEKEGCDYVLFDCQAGFNAPVEAVLPWCESAIIVTDADPLSVWAMNSLYLQLRQADILPKAVFGLVNRVMAGEEEYYRAMVDIISQVTFLGQLPFDKEVRRAFFRKEVPVDLENPSPFVMDLSRALRGLDAAIAERIEEKETWNISVSAAKANERYERLELLLSETEEKLFRLRYSEQRIKSRQQWVGAAVGLSYTLAGSILWGLEVGPASLGLTIAGVGMVVAILSGLGPYRFLPGLSRRRLLETGAEIARLEELVHAIREQLAEDVVRRVTG